MGVTRNGALELFEDDEAVGEATRMGALTAVGDCGVGDVGSDCGAVELARDMMRSSCSITRALRSEIDTVTGSAEATTGGVTVRGSLTGVDAGSEVIVDDEVATTAGEGGSSEFSDLVSAGDIVGSGIGEDANAAANSAAPIVLC